MNKKSFIKLVIDIIMTSLLLTLLAYRITDNTAHELAGVLIFALFIIHQFLNLSWYKTILKGKYNIFRVINTVINLLLIAIMSLLLASAVFISHTVFDFITAKSTLFIRQVHVLCAYWGLILISMHIGMHWSMITENLRRMCGISGAGGRMQAAIRGSFEAIVVVYGVYASFDRDVGSKLIMYYSFDFWNPDEPAALFFIANLAIMGMYILAVHYIIKFFQNQKQKTITDIFAK